MQVQLHKDQQRVIKTLAASDRFGLLWDVGCGKTRPTALDLLARRPPRTLIVSLLSVLPVWKDELQRLGLDPYKIVTVRGTPMKRRRLLKSVPEGGVALMNFDLVSPHLRELQEFAPECIIVDEAHRIINTRNKWSKALIKLGDAAKIKRILTGTPILHNELDFYGLMRFLGKDIIPYRSYFAFEAAHAIKVQYPTFSKIVGVRDREKILEWVAPYVDYLTFDEVSPNMPDWVEEQRWVPMTTEQKRVYTELKRDLLTQINERVIKAQNAGIALLRLSQVAGGFLDGEPLGSNKLAEAKEIISQVKGQIVIWAKFRAEVEWVAQQLGWSFIHGGVPDKQRQELLQKFAMGKLPGLVCQFEAIGVGVNELAGADAEIRWSYDYSYVSFDQSRGRLRRLNRAEHKACRSFMLITEGTVDQRVIAALSKKRNLAVSTLEDIKKILTD